jgi:multicomponent Na+:H+ antiporter subunit E
VIRSLSLFVFLYLFWLLLSGLFTPFLMASGVGCALVVTWFARRMHVVDDEGHPIQLGTHALVYWAWLFKEIIKSAWDVSKIILHPQAAHQPHPDQVQTLAENACGPGVACQLHHTHAWHHHD